MCQYLPRGVAQNLGYDQYIHLELIFWEKKPIQMRHIATGEYVDQGTTTITNKTNHRKQLGASGW